jgi:hypothetical protein
LYEYEVVAVAGVLKAVKTLMDTQWGRDWLYVRDAKDFED